MLLALLALAAGAIPLQAAPPKFVVILDPGHGGDDTGAVRWLHGRRIAEKNLTLAIARQTLEALRARGILAAMTRDHDLFVPLDRRTALANQIASQAQSSVFVSIHLNSSDEPRSAGLETYVFNATNNEASRRLADIENGKHRHTGSDATVNLILSDLATTANFAESMDLACTVQRSTAEGLRSHGLLSRSRGIKQALFYVLMQTRMPSILLEPGFISNPAELERISSPSFQRQLGASLANGIVRWRETQDRLASATQPLAIRSLACRR